MVMEWNGAGGHKQEADMRVVGVCGDRGWRGQNRSKQEMDGLRRLGQSGPFG